jgi:Co/Zn/Cd efflux system component
MVTYRRQSGQAMDDAARQALRSVEQTGRLRRIVATVALANLAYFLIEYTVAVRIGSVALFADSVDFLEDASVNLLVLLALGWSAAKRRFVGVVLAGLLLVPGLAALWTAYDKLTGLASVPEPIALTLTGAVAFIVNLGCALMLARVQGHGGALTRGAFLSARNDVLANTGIVAAGLATFALGSIWPDIVVGLAIAALNMTSAWEVYEAATEDAKDAGHSGDGPGARA